MILQVSLELASHLAEYSGLPRGQPADYFLSCLGPLVDLLASGFNDVDG